MTPEDMRQETLLHEYDRLKAEQTQRIGYRDNLIYLTLGMAGGIMAFALGKDGNPAALLVVPLSSFCLGSMFIDNDDKVSVIASYIRSGLRDQVSFGSLQPGLSAFIWEDSIREAPSRLWRKVLLFVANIFTFVATGLLALVVYWSVARPLPTWALGVMAVEILLLLILLGVLVVHADLGRRESTNVKQRGPSLATDVAEKP